MAIFGGTFGPLPGALAAAGPGGDARGGCGGCLGTRVTGGCNTDIGALGTGCDDGFAASRVALPVHCVQTKVSRGGWWKWSPWNIFWHRLQVYAARAVTRPPRTLQSTNIHLKDRGSFSSLHALHCHVSRASLLRCEAQQVTSQVEHCFPHPGLICRPHGTVVPFGMNGQIAQGIAVDSAFLQAVQRQTGSETEVFRFVLSKWRAQKMCSQS